jgi:hypothetical protein
MLLLPHAARNNWHHVDRQNALLQPDVAASSTMAGLFWICSSVGISARPGSSAPAVLHIGDFQPVASRSTAILDDVGELMQVLPVHDGIDRHGSLTRASISAVFDLFGHARSSSDRRHGRPHHGLVV